MKQASSFAAFVPRKFEIKTIPLWVGPVLICCIICYVYKGKSFHQKSVFVEDFRTRMRKRYGNGAVSPAIGLTELGERLDDDQCRQFANIYHGAVFRDRPLTESPSGNYLKQLLKKI